MGIFQLYSVDVGLELCDLKLKLVVFLEYLGLFLYFLSLVLYCFC
jgi:hypothetical protein